MKNRLYQSGITLELLSLMFYVYVVVILDAWLKQILSVDYALHQLPENRTIHKSKSNLPIG